MTKLDGVLGVKDQNNKSIYMNTVYLDAIDFVFCICSKYFL